MTVYIVQFRYRKTDRWQLHRAARGGLDIEAHTKYSEAKQEADVVRPYHARGCVRIGRFKQAT